MCKDNISWSISFDKQIENFIIAYEKALKLATDCYSINNELAYYLYKQLQACQEQVDTKTDECERLKAIAPMVECPQCGQYSKYWIDSFSERVDEGRSTVGYIYKCWHCGRQFCDENMETPLKLEQENTVLKQQLDYVQNNLNSTVEALEDINNRHFGCECGDKEADCFTCVQNLAKTALDKVKEKSR